jgi:hypothetical protein
MHDGPAYERPVLCSEESSVKVALKQESMLCC